MTPTPPAAPGATPGAAPGGQIDVEPMIAKARAGIPPNLQPIFDKAVLSGMRIMFDKSSHEMTMAELNKPGPLATRVSNGVIALVYLLWTQSNKTLPPQIMVPLTLVMALRAFQFLQMSKDPEATPQVLGDAVHDAVTGVMDRFGATQDKLPGLIQSQGQSGAPGAPPGGNPATAPAPAAAPAPAGGGMLGAATQGA